MFDDNNIALNVHRYKSFLFKLYTFMQSGNILILLGCWCAALLIIKACFT